MLRRSLVLFVAWAYALQAVAAVAATVDCGHADAPAAPHEASLALSVSVNGHEHDAPPAQRHDDAAADDCDRCPSCDQQGCTCGGHGCTSAPGATSGRRLNDALARAERFASLPAQSPLQPFSRGLIRPPSQS